MAELEAILIDKSAVPYRFDVDLAGEIFTFEIHYNGRFDYFTAHVEKDGTRLVDGEKIVYGRPLFSALNDTRLPNATITPFDASGKETWAGFAQLGETVFLYVDEGAG